MASKQTTEQYEAEVAAALDCIINAQDCFTMSEKSGSMAPATRMSWIERGDEYNRDLKQYRPKVRKAAYERYIATRKQ